MINLTPNLKFLSVSVAYKIYSRSDAKWKNNYDKKYFPIKSIYWLFSHLQFSALWFLQFTFFYINGLISFNVNVFWIILPTNHFLVFIKSIFNHSILYKDSTIAKKLWISEKLKFILLGSGMLIYCKFCIYFFFFMIFFKVWDWRNVV